MVRLLVLFTALSASAQQMRLDLAAKQGPLEMDHMALGQGGLSERPMWDERVNEVRMLRPRIIRLFIQEYFDVLPEPGKYHWDTLDASVDLIRKAGATPLMSINIKPRLLYPVIDEKIVDPSSYQQWEQLIYEMVWHYNQRGSGIQYWEVANEPDIGENGGCPYLFTPENYTRYYQHTVAAIRRADPAAKVGGPALANSRSPILPALLDFAEKSKIPLDFVSWHIYNSDPNRVRGTIDYVHDLLKKH
ncbi:MAG: glycosyl hydrolase, partial [Bryobacteraceae bacterium]